MNFCEKLLTLRKANNLTPKLFAKKLDVSRQSISKWKSGPEGPPTKKQRQKSDYLF